MVDTGAQFSPCKTYRYSLWRVWDEELEKVAFIGLNPSTADETNDDPTIRRCIGFAKRWGYGGLFMLNAFAFRATDPSVMKAASDPVGPENDDILEMYANASGKTIAAWGVHGSFKGRDAQVRKIVQEMHHLGLTKHGNPKHPLYLRADTDPILWK